MWLLVLFYNSSLCFISVFLFPALLWVIGNLFLPIQFCCAYDFWCISLCRFFGNFRVYIFHMQLITANLWQYFTSWKELQKSSFSYVILPSVSYYYLYIVQNKAKRYYNYCFDPQTYFEQVKRRRGRCICLQLGLPAFLPMESIPALTVFFA